MSRLITQLRAQRQSWVDLAPGKRVQIIRPAESQISEFLRTTGNGRSLVVELAQVCKYTVGWDGITEADLLGAAVGACDPVPFDSELWAEVVADRSEWLNRVAIGLSESITNYFNKKAEAEKNL